MQSGRAISRSVPRCSLPLVFVLAVSGQSFEAATVKPASPNGRLAGMPAAIRNGPAGDGIRFQEGPGRIDYVSVSLKELLARAYDVKPEQVSGPDWLGDERFDIQATMAPATDAAQVRVMLQQLLAERFQVRTHRETKPLRVYLLTMTKGGSKLKPAQKVPEYKDDEEAKAARDKSARAGLQVALARFAESGPVASMGATSSTVARLADELRKHLDRTVIDKTGLEGLYSCNLEWAPQGARSPGGAPSTLPSLFAAVEEQLGLHLQAETVDSEVLVVDSARRVPVEN